MRSGPRTPALLFLLALAALGACGRDAERGDAASVPATDPADEGLYGAPAAASIRVARVEAEIPGLPAGWEGARVAVLSDFQLGLWEDNARVAAAAVRKALELRPDLIVLLGDYVARDPDRQIPVLDRVLAPLRGRTVLAVLGDRDRRDESELDAGEADSTAIRIVQTLNRHGIVVLQNERGRVVRGGDTAYVAGIEPHLPRKPQWRQAEVFASIPRAGATPLLLSHMPAGVYAAPDSAYPLVLSGHTFCGRVEVPGTPRLSWANRELFPNPAMRIAGTDRLYRVDGNGLFVTCGVGYSFVPVRLGAPPEVALVTLRSPAAAEAAPEDTVRRPDVDSLLQQYERQRDTAAAADTAQGAPPGT